MRVLPLLFLTACFDGATTRLSVNLRSGTAEVAQVLRNAWPAQVGCTLPDGSPTSNDACVAAVRTRVDEGRATLVGNGATVRRAGIALRAGELDLVFDFTAPIGARALEDQGLALTWMDERTPREVARGAEGRRRAALVAYTEGVGDRVTVEGRYRRLTGAALDGSIDVWLFRGRSATITSEWTYTPGGDLMGGTESPGAWLAARPGLEDALRASGLVVSVPADGGS